MNSLTNEETNPVYVGDKERLRRLHTVITYHNDLYFVKETPEIPDSEYDKLYASYIALAEQYPEYAQELSGDKNINLPLSEPSVLSSITFKTPMMSLDKALNLEEFEKFINKLPEGTALDYEYKYDGLALEATFNNGVLLGLKTRYDGISGEDVIHNIDLFDSSLSLYESGLDGIHEVNLRGEAYISVANFIKINETLDKPYKTPRSAVAGLIRRLKENGDESFNGLVSFVVYYSDDDFGFKRYSEVKQQLRDYGFSVPVSASHRAIVLNERIDGIPTDGIVVKVDEIKLQRELGERQHNPRWAIAYKFPPSTASAEFLGVHWSLSMTGELTPVAIYTPVIIGGVTNTNATLFNYRTFKQKGLRLGARLEISRSGDCVPHITRVIENGKGKLVAAPKECPECGSVLMFNGVSDEEVNLYCPNSIGCKGQLAGRINQFLGKNALNVKGIGITTVTEWVKNGVIKNLSDLYKVDAELLGPRFHALIHANRKVTLSRFLTGLALADVGTVTAKELAQLSVRENKPILEVLSDSKSMIDAGINVGVALSVADYFSETDKYKEVEKLLSLLTIDTESDMVLMGKRVYLTGTSNLPRKEIKMLLATQGVELVENFNGKIDVLLIGERPSESKVATATKRNIRKVILNTPFNLNTVIKEVNDVN